jgi:hypothetical protein
MCDIIKDIEQFTDTGSVVQIGSIYNGAVQTEINADFSASLLRMRNTYAKQQEN